MRWESVTVTETQEGQKASMALASLRLKAQVFPAAHRALHDLPVPSLPPPPSVPLTPSAPATQPPRCSSITQARPAPGPLHRLSLCNSGCHRTPSLIFGPLPTLK
jgi:hypothetical protein